VKIKLGPESVRRQLWSFMLLYHKGNVIVRTAGVLGMNNTLDVLLMIRCRRIHDTYQGTGNRCHGSGSISGLCKIDFGRNRSQNQSGISVIFRFIFRLQAVYNKAAVTDCYVTRDFLLKTFAAMMSAMDDKIANVLRDYHNHSTESKSTSPSSAGRFVQCSHIY
jgi:hypothetical protein